MYGFVFKLFIPLLKAVNTRVKDNIFKKTNLEIFFQRLFEFHIVVYRIIFQAYCSYLIGGLIANKKLVLVFENGDRTSECDRCAAADSQKNSLFNRGEFYDGIPVRHNAPETRSVKGKASDRAVLINELFLHCYVTV